MADARLSTNKQDAEVDRLVNKRLADAGFKKPEDMGAGRADVGLTSKMLGDADPQLAPLLAEKEMRNAQWAQQAEGMEQPASEEVVAGEPVPDPDVPQDGLSKLQSQLKEAQGEVSDWKKRAGDDRNRVGEVRKRLQELEARVASNGNAQYQPQQPQYVPQYGQQGNEELTQASVMNLMLAQSQAFGQQLAQVRQQAIDAARGMQGYTLSAAEEADLQEQHPWLLEIQPGQREKAMMDLTANQKPNPSRAARTAQLTDVEQARGQARTFQYIEPSGQGSPPEAAAIQGQDSLMLQKAAKIKELLATPGKSEEAEALINAITPGGKRD